MYDPFTDFYCNGVLPNGMCLKDFQQKMPRGHHNQAQHHKNHPYIPTTTRSQSSSHRKKSHIFTSLQLHTNTAESRLLKSSGILFEPQLNSHNYKVRSEEQINKSSVSLIPLYFPRTFRSFLLQPKPAHILCCKTVLQVITCKATRELKAAVSRSIVKPSKCASRNFVCTCIILLLLLIMLQFL